MGVPVSFRFCLSCDQLTSFKYNKVIGHSECTTCGARFAVKNSCFVNSYKLCVQDSLKYIDKRINALTYCKDTTTPYRVSELKLLKERIHNNIYSIKQINKKELPYKKNG